MDARTMVRGAVAAAIGLCLSLPPHSAAAAGVAGPGGIPAPAVGGPRALAVLPIGSGAGEVGVESAAEGAWGVTAFALAPDGGIHVVDGVNDKVVVVRPDGTLDRELPFPEPLVCPEDIHVTEHGIYLMDVAAEPRVVCRLGEDGSLERLWPMPDELAPNAVTGFDVSGDDGEDVFLEVEASWGVPLIEDGKPVPGRSLPLVRRGNTADVPANEAAAFGLRAGRDGCAYQTSVEPGSLSASVFAHERGRRAREIRVAGSGEIGGIRVVGADEAGDEYVRFDQVLEGGRVETRLRAFGEDGRAKRDFRLPVERFATEPHRPVRVTPQGRVLCLVPGPDRVTIEELPAEAVRGGEPAGATASPGSDEVADTLLDAFRSLLDGAGSGLRAVLASSEAHAIWDRLDASDRANDYVTNGWYCNSANFSRSCGDYRPAYITASGRSYGSVPYCWGGFDTPSTFGRAMDDDKDAGDVNCTGSKRSCTAGVDCSGFVSRLWGLGTKRSTTGLKEDSYGIGWSAMRGCDAYVWPGHHAIAFRYFTSSGDSAVWESTTTSDKDRVVAWTRSKSYLQSSSRGYLPRRYENW